MSLLPKPTEVPAVSIESYRSVREAVALMVRHDVREVAIVTENRFCGVYTERELIADVAAGADLDGVSLALALKRKSSRAD